MRKTTQISESAQVLAKQIIKEAGEPTPAPAQTQAKAAPTTQQNAKPQADDKLSPAAETNLKQALDAIIQQLPAAASTFAKTQGDKDGKLELAVNKEAVNEALVTLAGAALAGPAVAKMMGKATSWLGKKLDSKSISSVGDKMAKFSDKWHHAYENSIYVFLRKMLPTTVKDEEVKQVSKVLFLAIIASMGVAAGAGAANFASAGQAGAAGLEGALASIKAGEVAGPVRAALGKILSTYFA